jgi:hypothetical protein
MENIKHSEQDIIDQIYEYVATLIVKEHKKESEIFHLLVEQGLDAETAQTVICNVKVQLKKITNERAHKNMIFGALWCVGGIIATVADFGYIFWGAILFGLIQFFKGVFKL